MGFAALAIDLGTAFTDRRKAQSTADLAAIAAVSDIANADKAAAATINRNQLAEGTSHQLKLGVYTADPKLDPASRFRVAASADVNAARVTVKTTTPLYFGRILTGHRELAIETTATAARTAFASFAIGSRLLKIDAGLLNQLLGSMLGTRLSLSVMDYQSLVDARVDLFSFLDSLAVKARLTAVTYDDLLKSNVRVDQAVNALLDTERQVYGSNHSAVRALADIARSLDGGSGKLPLGSIVDIGPYRSLDLGEHPKFGVSANALDLLTAMAQLANGQHQVETGLDLKVPGVLSATLRLAIGERPQGTSWITVGAEGASVHTAQTRLLLTVHLAGTAPIAEVALPIYIELASATARLKAISCGFPDIERSTVTLDVTPSIIDAWIGDVSNGQFGNFSNAPNPRAATLVNAPGLQITGRSHVAITNMTAQPVTFSYSDIQQWTKKTVTTRDVLTSVVTRLIGDLQLDAKVAGIGLGLPQASTQLLSGILSKAVSPIDQLLSPVLATMGVGLGQADAWVTGVRCDGAVLVL